MARLGLGCKVAPTSIPNPRTIDLPDSPLDARLAPSGPLPFSLSERYRPATPARNTSENGNARPRRKSDESLLMPFGSCTVHKAAKPPASRVLLVLESTIAAP